MWRIKAKKVKHKYSKNNKKLIDGAEIWTIPFFSVYACDLWYTIFGALAK